MNKGKTSVLREKSRVGNSPSKQSITPDMAVSYHGSILLLHPLTEAARAWMREHCPADADHTYFGGALVVEPRYIANLSMLARQDGLAM